MLYSHSVNAAQPQKLIHAWSTTLHGGKHLVPFLGWGSHVADSRKTVSICFTRTPVIKWSTGAQCRQVGIRGTASLGLH